MKQGHKGFTLVELLISSAIFIVVMVTIYSAMHTGIFGYRDIEDALDTSQGVRQIFERINSDLRNSLAYSKDEIMFTGSSNAISFFSLVDTFYEESITQDYALISYKLEGNKLMRLCLKNQEALNDNPEKEPEEFSAEIEEISFSYGVIASGASEISWEDSWDNPAELPLAVKTRLTLKNKIKQSFERTIFLPL